jgi:hypothetical protein
VSALGVSRAPPIVLIGRARVTVPLVGRLHFNPRVSLILSYRYANGLPVSLLTQAMLTNKLHKRLEMAQSATQGFNQ